jgi:hypothetical protein
MQWHFLNPPGFGVMESFQPFIGRFPSPLQSGQFFGDQIL